MAGIKINVHSDFFKHPKVQRLKVYCGTEADIFPIRLWSFVAKYFPRDGILADYTGAEIEGVLEWVGEKGALIDALVKVGFLDRDLSNVFRIHDWQEHAGFIWNYKEAGRKGGKNSGKSRRLKGLKNEATLQAKPKNALTIELNGIELNRDRDIAPPAPPVDKSVDKPKATLSDVQKVVTVFKLCQGVPREDKGWDKIYFGRYMRSAKELIGLLGSWEAAGDCVQDIYERLSGMGRTVTMETVIKHATEWRRDNAEKTQRRKYGVLPVQGHGDRPTHTRPI